MGECLCELDPHQPLLWCSVVKWRRDKQTPNNTSVIQRTLANILENVTIDELLQMANKHLYSSR